MSSSDIDSHQTRPDAVISPKIKSEPLEIRSGTTPPKSLQSCLPGMNKPTGYDMNISNDTCYEDSQWQPQQQSDTQIRSHPSSVANELLYQSATQTVAGLSTPTAYARMPSYPPNGYYPSATSMDYFQQQSGVNPGSVMNSTGFPPMSNTPNYTRNMADYLDSWSKFPMF